MSQRQKQMCPDAEKAVKSRRQGQNSWFNSGEMDNLASQALNLYTSEVEPAVY